MSAHGWISLVAAGGHLSLAFLVLSRRTRSPLAIPLALLCLDLFAWNLSALAYEVSGDRVWNRLDVALSPFTPPLGLTVVVSFVGRSRALRRVLVGAYACFAALSVSTAVPALRPLFDWGYVALEVPTAIFAITLLVLHLRRTTEDAERSRTRAILAAFAVAAVLGPTELLDDALPAIGNLGTLVSTTLIAVVALRLRLLGSELGAKVALYAATLAAVVVLGCLAVFRWIGASTALVVLGTVAVTVALLAATRETMVAYATHREKVTRLATLGRFSTQMAHDLKNPLATLKGSLQFLKEEHAQGRSVADQREFFDVMLDQVARLHRVVDEYQRIGRVDPVRAAVRMNDVVRTVLTLQPFAVNGDVAIATVLADDLPECRIDPDLVAAALENVVRNAIEAMPHGGPLTVRTERGDEGGIVISIEDGGEGMDARQMEHAFDDFYTTKPAGTGLGLAFVRRVVHAHGGEVSLGTRAGGGTIVRMRLPAGATG